MTSGNNSLTDELVCPRPPHFKPRTLQNSKILISQLCANASLESKGKQSRHKNIDSKEKISSSKKPKVSIMTFLSKKVKQREQKIFKKH